ncbi:MAG TPA: hypothetical protein VII72_01250 [Myxococcota bacterium]
MTARLAGASLVIAAALFWLSWLLMPGVGITDAGRILELVGRHAGRVRVSVAAQLLSAACYAPALVGIVATRRLRRQRQVRAGAILLAIGAMGSAADAVFHLLAVEMVAPGIDRTAMLPVMERMQGAGLLTIAPLIAAFFVGSGVLALGFARAGVVPRGNPLLIVLALALAGIGGPLAAGSAGAARAVGLAVLGLVSASQAWLGLGLWRRPPAGSGG